MYSACLFTQIRGSIPGQTLLWHALSDTWLLPSSWCISSCMSSEGQTIREKTERLLCKICKDFMSHWSCWFAQCVVLKGDGFLFPPSQRGMRIDFAKPWNDFVEWISNTCLSDFNIWGRNLASCCYWSTVPEQTMPLPDKNTQVPWTWRL